MSHDLTVGELDRDGALEQAIAVLHGETRATFLRRAVVGGAALLGVSAAPAQAAADGRDEAILNYALTLEYVQEAFYGEAERLGVLTGGLAEQARVVGAHERAHVKAFREVLGAAAVKRPRFDFRGATENADAFRRTAVAFEDLAVAAYKGQAPLIQRGRTWSQLWPSTRSRRVTRRGSGGSPASRRPRTRSTSRARNRARWGSSRPPDSRS